MQIPKSPKQLQNQKPEPRVVYQQQPHPQLLVCIEHEHGVTIKPFELGHVDAIPHQSLSFETAGSGPGN